MNNKSLSAVALAALVAAALSGCVVVPSAGEELVISDQGACLDSCEERNASCPDLTYDCATLCDTREQMGCLAETDALDACRSDAGDVCGTPTECQDEESAAVECLIDYCIDHPGEGSCPAMN